MKMLCFDMDGTIADTYAVDKWLDKLQAEDASPYQEAQPMWDMVALNEVLMLLEKQGWEVRVISWLAKDSSKEYAKATREAKAQWLEKYQFPAQKCHFIQYGATKANSVREACSDGYAILFDDNDKIRQGWHLGDTINPTTNNLIDVLKALLEDE